MHFFLIALVDKSNEAVVQRLADQLTPTFGVDLRPHLSNLTTTGVCVMQGPDAELLRMRGQAILSAGGKWRIVDGVGKVVAESTQSVTQQPVAQQSVAQSANKTLLWGQPPVGNFGSTQAAPGAGARSSTLPATSGKLNAALRGAGPQASAPGFNLDNLDENALVMLDGGADPSAEPSPAPPRVGAENPPPKVAPPPAAAAKSRPAETPAEPAPAAPPEDFGGLELESPSESVAKGSMIPTSSNEPLELDVRTNKSTANTGAPSSAPASRSADATQELEVPPALPGSYKDADNAEAEVGALPPMSSLGSRTPTPILPSQLQQRLTLAQTAAKARRRKAVLFGGRLQERPKLRIALGYAAALFLGSIVPMCYAHTKPIPRIEELRVDLSTAKAHGEILSKLPGYPYQPPDQITHDIRMVKIKHGFATFLLWTLFAALIGAAWFKYT